MNIKRNEMFKRINEINKGLKRDLLVLMVIGNIAIAIPIFYRAKAMDPVGNLPTNSEVVMPSLLELFWSSAIIWIGVYLIMTLWLSLVYRRKRTSGS